MSSSNKTFLGFWPTRENFGEISLININNVGIPDKKSRDQLKETIYLKPSAKWEIIVAVDYMVLLHLRDLEHELHIERNQNKDKINFSMRGTMAAWPVYLESLNAIYFLLFAAMYTGRNLSYLHDFSEITLWDCSRLIYNQHNKPLRHAHFGRKSEHYLRRFGECIYSAPITLSQIDKRVFDDMAHYWSTIYNLKLIKFTSVGTKILYEHRIKNFNASVTTAWFEIENWITEYAHVIGVPLTDKDNNSLEIKRLINKFPLGTMVSNLSSDLHAVRIARNNIAHSNSAASFNDSQLAITCFMKIFNLKTGLPLNIDFNAPPIFGL